MFSVGESVTPLHEWSRARRVSRNALICGLVSNGQKRRPSQPRHVSFRQLRTLIRASIRWSNPSSSA
jgi:hypothetical protein